MVCLLLSLVVRKIIAFSNSTTATINLVGDFMTSMTMSGGGNFHFSPIRVGVQIPSTRLDFCMANFVASFVRRLAGNIMMEEALKKSFNNILL